jgi:Tfp pilus assembly protein PilO
MTLGLSRRAAVLVFAGILFAANLAFFLWYRATAQQRKNEMESRRAQLTRDVDARELEATNLKHQRDRLSEVSAAVEDFYGKRIGPSRDTLGPVVLEIHTLLQRTNIAPTQISYSTKAMQDLPLSEMHVNFTFRNDYLRFKQLLASIESDRRWIVVREIGLNRDTEIPGSVQVRMTLATYFAREEQPRTSMPTLSAAGARR